MAIGIKTATIAVLLINADKNATKIHSTRMRRHSCLPDSLSTWNDIQRTTPVRTNPVLRTNNAAIVAVAGLVKPYSACSG